MHELRTSAEYHPGAVRHENVFWHGSRDVVQGLPTSQDRSPELRKFTPARPASYLQTLRALEDLSGRNLAPAVTRPPGCRR